MDIDIAVVPVAGLGTRLLPATKSQPKEMLPVGRKPVVQYVIEELTRVGTRQVLFVTGPGKASIENHFDLNGDLIQTLRETGKEELLAELEFRALGGAVLLHAPAAAAGPGPRGPVRPILRGTPPLHRRPGRLHHRHARRKRRRPPDGALLPRARRGGGDRLRGSRSRGRVVRTAWHRRRRPATCSNWPTWSRSRRRTKRRATWPSRPATSCRPPSSTCLERIPPGKGGEIQLTDAIRTLIREGGRAYGVRLTGGERRYDIGNFDAYFQAFVEFALADPKHGAALRRHLEGLLHVPHA